MVSLVSKTTLLALALVASTSSSAIAGDLSDANQAAQSFRQSAPVKTKPTPKPSKKPTFHCAHTPVVVKCQGVDDPTKGISLDDGDAKECQISLSNNATVHAAAVVTVKTDEVIALSQTNFTFGGPKDSNKYTFLLKTNPAVTADKASITINWNYPDHPDCNQTQQVFPATVTRPKTCSAVATGDPHFRTVDGAAYDFQGAGVYNMLYSKGLRIQAYQEQCNVPGVTCVRGVAIGFGESVVRFRFDDGASRTVRVAKGSGAMDALSIEAPKGNAFSYRVFLTYDPSSYVDVNANTFTNGRGATENYFDISAVVSQYLCKTAKGLFKDPNERAPVDANDNLFNCEDCSKQLEVLTAADKIPLKRVALLHDGYDVVNADKLTAAAFKMGARRVLRAQVADDTTAPAATATTTQLNEDEVRDTCKKVIESVTGCSKFVDTSFYVENACVKDVLLLNSMDAVDAAKVAFARDCRQSIDTKIVFDSPSLDGTKSEAKASRAALKMGKTGSCVNSCGGHGTCLLNACRCESGFSGLGCSIRV